MVRQSTIHSKGGAPGPSRKRKFYGNRHTVENTNFATRSAKKLLNTKDREITVDQTHGYRFVQFPAVFSAISQLIVCRVCHKDVQFSEASERGLGFKIAVNCECGTTYINSCPLIDNAFEINRRIVCVMRLLGIGNNGLNLFCGLMDLTKEFYNTTYCAALGNLITASKAVYELCTSSAIQEEKEKTLTEENVNTNLTVSGDGTWRRRGISSLSGVATLIGKHSCKVIDLVIKSTYCEICKTSEAKLDDEEHDEWNMALLAHESQCAVNKEESAGKMGIAAIEEMFGRSVQNHKVKYTLYGNIESDNETFNGLFWHFAPKHIYSGAKTVEIAAYLATGIYNEGYYSVLKTFETMGIVIGSETKSFADSRDAKRILVSEKRPQKATKSTLNTRRQTNPLAEFYEEEEGVL